MQISDMRYKSCPNTVAIPFTVDECSIGTSEIVRATFVIKIFVIWSVACKVLILTVLYHSFKRLSADSVLSPTVTTSR